MASVVLEKQSWSMPHPVPEWQHLFFYAIVAALLIMILQRLPYVGRVIRFALSLGLLAFFIFVLLEQAPYQPQLARFTDKLGLDDQQVAGRELHVRMSPDGHFWVVASINGVPRRMLIVSGATITAISQATAREARVDTGVGLAPVVLQTANGAATAKTGKVSELKVGNIVARNLRIVTSPGLGSLDVLGMNFLTKLQSWRVENQTLILVPHHPQDARS
ncbi:MAG TPA: TIGR02281 family clan AA aspartic protease [Sphingomicrobium sp.]|nr:TIGR02281 family clan AA aspartic protease [Sphingomicrobium sp.]